MQIRRLEGVRFSCGDNIAVCEGGRQPSLSLSLRTICGKPDFPLYHRPSNTWEWSDLSFLFFWQQPWSTFSWPEEASLYVFQEVLGQASFIVVHAHHLSDTQSYRVVSAVGQPVQMDVKSPEMLSPFRQKWWTCSSWGWERDNAKKCLNILKISETCYGYFGKCLPQTLHTNIILAYMMPLYLLTQSHSECDPRKQYALPLKATLCLYIRSSHVIYHQRVKLIKLLTQRPV